jgi:hypothetical protein
MGAHTGTTRLLHSPIARRILPRTRPPEEEDDHRYDEARFLRSVEQLGHLRAVEARLGGRDVLHGAVAVEGHRGEPPDRDQGGADLAERHPAAAQQVDRAHHPGDQHQRRDQEQDSADHVGRLVVRDLGEPLHGVVVQVGTDQRAEEQHERRREQTERGECAAEVAVVGEPQHGVTSC